MVAVAVEAADQPAAVGVAERDRDILGGLLSEGVVKAGSIQDLRRYDHLINYFYLPEIAGAEFPESVALLYSAITVHHDYLDERRIAQLADPAAVHLKYKLTSLYAGSLFSHADFEDKIN